MDVVMVVLAFSATVLSMVGEDDESTACGGVVFILKDGRSLCCRSAVADNAGGVDEGAGRGHGTK